MCKWFIAMTLVLGVLSFPTIAFSETSKSWRKNNKRTERSLCSRVEGGKKFKVMANYARKKSTGIEDFFEFALCWNASNIEVHFADGKSVISPLFMVMLKPHSRFTILNGLMNYHKDRGTVNRLVRILNQRAEVDGITVLDFLERRVMNHEYGSPVYKMYNVIRRQICSFGGRHAKKENAGKCTDAFLDAQ